MKLSFSLVHALWIINGRSSPLSIKHTNKPKKIEYKIETCIYKQ